MAVIWVGTKSRQNLSHRDGKGSKDRNGLPGEFHEHTNAKEENYTAIVEVEAL